MQGPESRPADFFKGGFGHEGFCQTAAPEKQSGQMYGSGLQIQRLLSLSVSGRLTISACDRRLGSTDLQMVWQPVRKCPSSIRGKGIFYTAQNMANEGK